MLGLTLYIAHATAFAILLREDGAGLLWWMLIVTGTWSMDTLAYAGGRAYGRRPIAPKLSPGKTIEGTITGFIGSVLIAGGIALRLGVPLTPLIIALLIGTPVVALIGDLSESKVKRMFGIKDSAVRWLNIIPGHGGILDRVDSLLLVVVFYFIVISVIRG
jgi:phosphatidate cytidylyltransferase